MKSCMESCENESMIAMAESIIANGEKIKIYENELKFNVKKDKNVQSSCFVGKATINGKTCECVVNINRDSITIDINGDDYVKINYKGKTFRVKGRFILDSDFSIKEFCIKNDNTYSFDGTFQDIMLKLFRSCKIYNQNFYTFEKEDNGKYFISKEEQSTTFEFFDGIKKLEKSEKMSKDEREKFDLLKRMDNITGKRYRTNSFKVTFIDEAAFLLVKNNLLFFKKQNEGHEEKM